MAPFFSIQIISTFIKLSRKLAQRREKFPFPVYFTCGNADQVTLISKCRQYYERVRLHSNSEFHEVDGGLHDILHDLPEFELCDKIIN